MRIFQIITRVATIFFALEKWFFMYTYEVEIFKSTVYIDYCMFYIQIEQLFRYFNNFSF